MKSILFLLGAICSNYRVPVGLPTGPMGARRLQAIVDYQFPDDNPSANANAVKKPLKPAGRHGRHSQEVK